MNWNWDLFNRILKVWEFWYINNISLKNIALNIFNITKYMIYWLGLIIFYLGMFLKFLINTKLWKIFISILFLIVLFLLYDKIENYTKYPNISLFEWFIQYLMIIYQLIVKDLIILYKDILAWIIMLWIVFLFFYSYIKIKWFYHKWKLKWKYLFYVENIDKEKILVYRYK
jgi:hypothetical protein